MAATLRRRGAALAKAANAGQAPTESKSAKPGSPIAERKMTTLLHRLLYNFLQLPPPAPWLTSTPALAS